MIVFTNSFGQNMAPILSEADVVLKYLQFVFWSIYSFAK
jgi:hypothetical protein